METNSVPMTIISKEMIKPSSETPHHLKTHKLSLLDRRQPPVYIPIIFFYEANDFINGSISTTTTTTDDHHRAQMSEKLRRSLSDTLTTFYPLAGKIDEESFMVDCNDSGVMYVEARAHARLSDTIQQDSLTREQLKSWLPFSPTDVDDNILLAMQINFFDCGGVAIGLCFSHQMGDGISALMFMNWWATTCRGGEVDDPRKTPLPRPNFDLADHLPNQYKEAVQEEGENINSLAALLCVPEEAYLSKRFVFDKEKLAALRDASFSSADDHRLMKDPTRVELVSAFIWKHFIQAAAAKQNTTTTRTSSSSSIHVAIHAVNLRKRVIPPPYLENVFGNCFTIATAAAVTTHDRPDPEIHDLVSEFRNAIRGVNDESIRKMQSHEDEDSLKRFKQLMSKGGGGIEAVEYFCGFSSWCRFGAYEVDYGWGKPIWVATIGLPVLNSVILMDDSSGDGIEAWINALPHQIQTLEEAYVHQLRTHVRTT